MVVKSECKLKTTSGLNSGAKVATNFKALTPCCFLTVWLLVAFLGDIRRNQISCSFGSTLQPHPSSFFDSQHLTLCNNIIAIHQLDTQFQNAGVVLFISRGGITGYPCQTRLLSR